MHVATLRHLLFQYAVFTLFTRLLPILATFLPGIEASTLPICWVYLVYPFTSHPCHFPPWQRGIYSSSMLGLPGLPVYFSFLPFSSLPIRQLLLHYISHLLEVYVNGVYSFNALKLPSLPIYFPISSLSMRSTPSIQLVYLVYLVVNEASTPAIYLIYLVYPFTSHLRHVPVSH